MADSDTERNKALVERFIREIPHGPGDNLHVIDELVREDYIQHNPLAGQGREGLKRFFTDVVPLPLPADLGPGNALEVRVIAEGDLVVRQEIHHTGMLVDIFRIQDGQLAEHWDAWRTAEGHEPAPGF